MFGEIVQLTRYIESTVSNNISIDWCATKTAQILSYCVPCAYIVCIVLFSVLLSVYNKLFLSFLLWNFAVAAAVAAAVANAAYWWLPLFSLHYNNLFSLFLFLLDVSHAVNEHIKLSTATVWAKTRRPTHAHSHNHASYFRHIQHETAVVGIACHSENG